MKITFKQHARALLAMWLLGGTLQIQAASTSIADVPLAVVNPVPPNMIFTLDNSGGVDVEVLLPTFNSMYYETLVTADSNLHGNFYLFPLPYRPAWTALFLEGDTGSGDTNHWRVRNYDYNPQYYNPARTYLPWKGTDSAGNVFADATATAIKLDPYANTKGTFNLTTSYTSGTGGVPTAHSWLTTLGAYTAAGRAYNSTWTPAVYYNWTDTNLNGVQDVGEGARVEIKSAVNSYSYTDVNGVSQTRTYAQELQNFANWFQYYRTPFLSLQAALGDQIATLTGMKVGVVDFKATTASVLPMSSAANVTTFRDTVYRYQPDLVNWGQPVHERLSFVYQQMKALQTAALSCQQNYHVLATPGYLNELTPYANPFTAGKLNPLTVGNYDGTSNAFGNMGSAPYTDGSSETLADRTAKYYEENIDTAKFTATNANVPLSATAHETNIYPHVTQYVLAPGAIPTVPYIPANTDPWTVTPSITWPVPVFVGQTTIDDLWHAAVNGRGAFINDVNVSDGLSKALKDILSRGGNGLAVSSRAFATGDSTIYSPKYETGNWTGDLNAYLADPLTGAAVLTDLWVPSAQARLDATAASARVIAGYNGTVGAEFTSASGLYGLTAAQINYIRGVRTGEGSSVRARIHLLGDIVNALPVVLREPLSVYQDNGYRAFKYANGVTNPRTKVVFQAANDGMLHTFDAATGAELWAYVPRVARTNLANLSSLSFSHKYTVDATPSISDVDFNNTPNIASGVKNTSPDWRTLLVGGLNKGGFGYYALDVTAPDRDTTAGTPPLTQAQLATKVKWEFPNATTNANVGYSFGKPLITKIGSGTSSGWVALVTSGYNNGTGDSGGDGKGHLFVLDAKTGALIKDLVTTAGSASAPSGLAKFTAYALDPTQDNTVELVYGGDLLGNVWRFDLTDADPNNWSVSLLATLVDASGIPQPITAKPTVALVRGKRMVYVGTGKYLEATDMATTQTQSMYALQDDYSSAAPTNAQTISSPRTQLNKMQFTTTGLTRSVALQTSAGANSKGWFVDLPTAGERVVHDFSVAVTSLVFNTNIPNDRNLSNQCLPQGSSWQYQLSFINGKTVFGTVPGRLYQDKWLGDVTFVKTKDGKVTGLENIPSGDVPSIKVSGHRSGFANRVGWREIVQHR